ASRYRARPARDLDRRFRRAAEARAVTESEHDHMDHLAALRRRHRQVGTDSALRLVAGRDGGSDAGKRAHPCRDHGDRRPLGAGSVIHALEGEQDMREMGGLRSYLPTTYWTYLIATLAIAGAPFTAGFFSKDLILWQAYSSPLGSHQLWLIAWVTAGMTALYMFRQFFMVFHGTRRADEHVRAHIHESPEVMTGTMVLLAMGSIFAGW